MMYFKDKMNLIAVKSTASEARTGLGLGHSSTRNLLSNVEERTLKEKDQILCRFYGDIQVIRAVYDSILVPVAVKSPGAFAGSRCGAGRGPGRRRWDSNPRRLFTLHDFQSC